jgi:hypothetical protein
MLRGDGAAATPTTMARKVSAASKGNGRLMMRTSRGRIFPWIPAGMIRRFAGITLREMSPAPAHASAATNLARVCENSCTAG